ncbi:oxygenase MpaB family protein [Burkholderia ambifaria]|uniref:oxygenase MpaB family protein n=1 Tax=Burkholderia ambifaria TaxID=152480 RepID=UPI0013DF9156|nr:oxygenase MpaB family protein [Burkholderia ambifaria]
MKRGYKWIDKEIARLDPETDYEAIMSLVSAYMLDDFVLNIAYVVNFINVVAAPHGADALMHTGKVVHHQQKRFDDSIDFLLTWYLLGPSNPAVQQSVARLNKMHAAIARGIPESFRHNDDFLIALCLVALFDDRLRRTLGLPGIPDHMKTVYHHWLRDLSELFTTGTSSGHIDDFPATFEGLEAFAIEFESREYPSTENGHVAAEALISQFINRRFPRWKALGRTIILVFTPERVRKVHRLGEPNRVLAPLVKLAFRLAFLLKEHVLPDPEETIIERKAKNGTLSPILKRLLPSALPAGDHSPIGSTDTVDHPPTTNNMETRT